MKFRFIFFTLFILFGFTGSASAHQPRIIFYTAGDIKIQDPEISQAFYDELKGVPRDYSVDFSGQGGELYLNLLTPEFSNPEARFSANVFSLNGEEQKPLFSIDGSSFKWQEFYEEFGRDYYLKGPELTQQVPAGSYKIEVFSKTNQGKYVLAVGKKEFFDIKSLLNIYWQLPLLKIQFFKTSVWQFFLTPFGIGLIAVLGGILILIFLLNYFVALAKEIIKHNQAKTLLLTSAGMQMKDEILKLLQRPIYDVNVAFINTASKPEEDKSYMQKDLREMREIGFNVEEIDIEGKNYAQLMRLLEVKDIIFVEGGNTFYLMRAIRQSGFEKAIRKLLKMGKVYIGVSAGSMVAGKTIITSVWRGEARGINRNKVELKDLRGMNLVPFDIFVHYAPEYAEKIKQEMPNEKKRKKLKIITDDQAILVQGKEQILLGKGEEIRI